MSPFRTLQQSAAWLGLSVSQVRALVRRGLLAVHNHGVRKKLVIAQSELERFSESRRIVPEVSGLSRFEAARERVRSLKTQETRPKTERKGA